MYEIRVELNLLPQKRSLDLPLDQALLSDDYRLIADIYYKWLLIHIYNFLCKAHKKREIPELESFKDGVLEAKEFIFQSYDMIDFDWIGKESTKLGASRPEVARVPIFALLLTASHL